MKNALKFLTTALGKTLFVVTVLVVVPATAIGLAFIGLPVAGIDWFDAKKETVVAQKEVEINNVSYNNTPAQQAFDTTFKRLDKQWTATPLAVDSAGLPHPMDCVTPTPSLSFSKSYENSGMPVQVTLAAYPAGLGAEAYERLFNAGSCKPSSTSYYPYADAGLGVESATATVSWGTNNIKSTFFRRGDVVAIVVTDKNKDSKEQAAVVDKVLKTVLTPNVCVNIKSGILDKNRNAFAAKGAFTGALEDQALTTEKLERPDLSDTQLGDGVVQTRIPAKLETIAPVVLPNSNVTYPLWPLLPKEKTHPTVPSKPTPQKLASTTEIRVDDIAGPGCGWAFLETIQPEFDATAVAASNKATIDAAQALLDSDGPRWQKDVLKYWEAVAQYRIDVEEYKEYKEQVESIRTAWEVIHQQWREYYTAYANWEQVEQDRLDLIASKEAAKKLWAEQKQACIDLPILLAEYEVELNTYNTVTIPEWEAAVEQFELDLPELMEQYEAEMVLYKAKLKEYRTKMKKWRENDKKGKKPTKPVEPLVPAAPEKPVRPVKPSVAHSCPPPKPTVLNTKVPKETEPPAKPADPRPVDQR